MKDRKCFTKFIEVNLILFWFNAYCEIIHVTFSILRLHVLHKFSRKLKVLDIKLRSKGCKIWNNQSSSNEVSWNQTRNVKVHTKRIGNLRPANQSEGVGHQTHGGLHGGTQSSNPNSPVSDGLFSASEWHATIGKIDVKSRASKLIPGNKGLYQAGSTQTSFCPLVISLCDAPYWWWSRIVRNAGVNKNH